MQIIAHNVAPMLLLGYAEASGRLWDRGESIGTKQPTEFYRQSAACNIMNKTVAKTYAAGSPAASQGGTGLYAADGGRKHLKLAERHRALGTMAKLDPDKALFALTLAWSGARVSETLKPGDLVTELRRKEE